MKFKPIFILIFVFIQTVSTKALAYIDEDEYERRASECLTNDRNDDAITYALRIIEQNPNHETAYAFAALGYKNIQFYSEAVRYFKLQIEKNASFRNIGNLGSVYGELEYDSLAQQTLKKALAQDSEYAYAHNNLGALHIGFNRYDEAEPYLLKAIEYNPEMWNAYLNMAIVYNHREQYKDAILSLETCLDLNPYSGDAKKLLGDIKAKVTGTKAKGLSKSDLEEAIALYTRSIKRNRYHTQSILQRARTYELLGEKELALNDYKAALIGYNEIVDDVPDSREMRHRRASIFRALKQYDLAMEDYNYVLKLYPNDELTLDKIEETKKEQ